MNSIYGSVIAPIDDGLKELWQLAKGNVATMTAAYRRASVLAIHNKRIAVG